MNTISGETTMREPLPLSRLADEMHIAFMSEVWNVLQQRLKATAPNEGCAFALTWPSIGLKRTTVIVGKIIWPKPGEVEATPNNLEISSNYISRALDAAIDAGEQCGVALIHTHPESLFGKGQVQFSTRDDWYELRLFPTFTKYRRHALCASLVFGSEQSEVDGRVWWQDQERTLVQRAQVVRVVGPELQFFETPHSQWKDHLDPAVMDRSTRLWGDQGRRRLQNIRAGVIGGGGTGSIALLALATMGVGKIEGWDKDIVKKENLHRMLGATRDQIGINKMEALGVLVRNVATAQPFDLQEHPQWGTTNEALRQLKDCDVIFSCVDMLAARVPLNDLAYAHLIPTLDVASWIHASNGKVDSISTHAHVWSPGIPCAWCKQTLTSYGLMQEAQGTQRGIEHRAPYGLSLEDTDGIEPSVLALNMIGVSLALMQFMQVALGITGRTPRDLKFFLPEWELDESDLNTRDSCKTELRAGLGDSIFISGD